MRGVGRAAKQRHVHAGAARLRHQTDVSRSVSKPICGQTKLIKIGWSIFGWKTKEFAMHRILLLIAVVVGTSAPALAQKSEIEAANAQWIEFFDKGDFAGIASLYATDATAFPPGSAMVHGNTAIGAMWKKISEEVIDPKLVTLDVKPLGPSHAQEIGTFKLKTRGPNPKDVIGKYLVVWEKVGNDWKLSADIWNDGQ